MKQKAVALCIVLLSFFASAVQAQKSTAILKGGLNLANVSITDDGGIDDAKTLASFQVGIIGDLNITSFFAIQPGLVFTGKGTKAQSGTEGSASWYKATSNPWYLEVPVNFVFKTPTGPVKFFAGAGPYIAMGIAGKNKVEGAILGTGFSSENNIEFSNDDPSTLNEEEGAGFGVMKRFDYGLNGLLGIETSSIIISANYGLGLAKLQSGSNAGEDNNNKHRVISFTLGVKL
ncbi:MAG: PorT family protein [Chitinophagaceae bacterium]|nr:PorT family protein [Chitinophagaceae bacterium]